MCMHVYVYMYIGIQAANAPMYFKKAINESENEFESQNKALIDTRGD